MTENKRFKWEDVYKWEVPAFLEVMNGLHEKNERLKKENEELKRENHLLVSFIRRNHDVTMVSRILKE